jgi:NhaP-type Na+/H+ or K+/H+ antiporter
MKKLRAIKLIHTTVWIFFNLVLFYLFYAAIFGEIDKWVWIGLGLFALESVVLLAYGMVCPLTVLARKYSSSTKDNFDIFLPNWLARNNKLIYSILLGITILLILYRVVK